jgi:tRNA threonylcarbamoyladenosine biosynthesis protein TsaB
MKVLALDTTLQACSAAVCDDAVLLAWRYETMTRGHAERIVPMILEVLEEAGLAFADLHLLAVTTGPGSFTGVRVGLAAARGLALAADLPLAGMSTHEALAEAVDPSERDGRCLAVALDARRGQIYLQTFDATGETFAPPMVAERTACRLPDGPWFVVGSGADALAGQPDAKIDPAARLPDARCVARRAARIYGKGGMTLPSAPPAPVYLRAADAKRPGDLAPVRLRLAGAEEADALSALHGRCFDEPWSADFIARVIGRENSFALVAIDPEERPMGFAFVRQTADEAELLSIGVVASARRSGIGARLLAGVTDRVRSAGAACLFLEVAEDNIAARTLYARTGYAQTGRRKDYYDRGTERVDALTLTRTLR